MDGGKEEWIFFRGKNVGLLNGQDVVRIASSPTDSTNLKGCFQYEIDMKALTKGRIAARKSVHHKSLHRRRSRDALMREISDFLST